MFASSTVPGRARALVGFAAFGAFWGTWGASLPRVQSHAAVTDAELGAALLWVGVGALGSIRLAAVAYLVENAWQSWGAIQLHTTVGASLAVSALAPAVFATAAAVGRFAGHALTGARPAATLFGIGAAIAGAGSVLGALASSTALVLLGIAVAGLGTSVCAPTLIALAGRTAPGAPGAATGTVITVAYLGFVLGPAAVGLVSGATTLPTALLGVAILAGLLLLSSPLLARIAAQ